MALTVVRIDGRRVMCSALDEDGLRNLYGEVVRRGLLKPRDGSEDRPLELGLPTIGPIEIDLGESRLILWGAANELRFYTPDEFAVITGEDPV